MDQTKGSGSQIGVEVPITSSVINLKGDISQPNAIEVEIAAPQTYCSFEDLKSQDWINELVEQWKNECNRGRLRQAIEAEISDSQSWKSQFNVLDRLRAVNKFRSTEFCEKVLPCLIEPILILADSIRSNLQKNALLLLTEILQINPVHLISDKHLFAIQKVILDKSISEKTFIKQQAKAAIAALETNPSSLCDHNLEGIQTLCLHKNVQISELACSTLHRMIFNKKHDLEIIQGNALSSIISTLSKCLQSKRAILKKLSKEISVVIYAAKGNIAFISISEEDRQCIMNAISSPKSDQKLTSFRDFLALKKKDQI